MPLMKRGTPFNLNWKFLPYSSFSLFNSIFLIPIFLEVESTSLPPDTTAALISYSGCSALPDNSYVHQSSGSVIVKSASVPLFSSVLPSGNTTFNEHS